MVVDDEPAVRVALERALRIERYNVRVAGDGTEALALLADRSPDAIVLDVAMPGVDGLEVCRRLRERWPIPVVMLTALGDETDRLAGFEIGADDYVTKPFSPRELAMRVRSVLRRSRSAAPADSPGAPGQADQGILTDRDVLVDLAAHEVRIGGKLVQLTSREYDLLVFLLRNPRQAFTREQLLSEVWGWTFGDTSTVTVHVRRLREKLESGPTLPRRIVTVWGVGYRYEPGEA